MTYPIPIIFWKFLLYFRAHGICISRCIVDSHDWIQSVVLQFDKDDQCLYYLLGNIEDLEHSFGLNNDSFQIILVRGPFPTVDPREKLKVYFHFMI